VLVLGRRVGEGVMIGHDIKVTVLVVAGDKVRIGIDAPAEIEVHREEVYLEIQQANLEAASTSAEGVAGLSAVLRDREPEASEIGDPATSPTTTQESAARTAGGAGQVEGEVSGSAAR
jgi:carbon storage regulator